MVLYTLTAWPDRFQKGISGAPVSDWKLYDTIYSERYMDELEANRDGYRQSSPTTRADQLQAELLLVHSALDEIRARYKQTFQSHGSWIDQPVLTRRLRNFPARAHGVPTAGSYLYLMQPKQPIF